MQRQVAYASAVNSRCQRSYYTLCAEKIQIMTFAKKVYKEISDMQFEVSRHHFSNFRTLCSQCPITPAAALNKSVVLTVLLVHSIPMCPEI